jgi:hypothetical protein
MDTKSKGSQDDLTGLSIDNLGLDFIEEEETQEQEGLTQEDKDILTQEDETSGTSEEESEEFSDDYMNSFFNNEETSETSEEESGESEEQEETEEDTTEQSEGEEASEEGEAETPLHLHAAIMKERGLLPSSFDPNQVEGETLDEQIESLANEIEKGYEDRYSHLKNGLDSLSKEVVEKIQQGFSEEEAKQSVVNREKINSITDEQLENDEKLQENLYREYLQKQNVPEKLIDKYIKKSRDADSLYEDSKEARESLPELYKQEDQKKQEEIQRQQQQQEQKRQETIQKLENQLNSLEGQEVYPGVKITKNDIPKIKEKLLQPVKYEEDENGNQIPISREAQLKREDPINYWIRWAALDNAGAFDKNADQKKVKQRQETEATKKLSKRIQEQQKKEKSKKSGINKGKTKQQESEIAFPDFGSLGIK